MSRRQNLHTHTAWDDGAASPLDMARAAAAAGLTSLGFSVHSPLPWDNDWAVTAERLPAYRAEIAAVREAFRGTLDVYDGIEWDSRSPLAPDGFDYVIGSVHTLAPGGEDTSVDCSPDVTRTILRERFGGDERAMARSYFAQYAALADEARVDVIGHFDLLTKFSQRDGLFDAHAPWLLDLAAQVMEPLIAAGRIFEVNTGAMARGYRTEPYPSLPLLRSLYALGGRVTLSSDAHRPEHLTYAFTETEAWLRDIGFRELWVFDGNGFVPEPL